MSAPLLLAQALLPSLQSQSFGVAPGLPACTYDPVLPNMQIRALW
ncbi:MAG: hypothetical protein WAM11_10930 [Cyanobium sp.]